MGFKSTGVITVNDGGGAITVDGSLTAVDTITNAVTVAQPTGTQLHVVIDSGTVTQLPHALLDATGNNDTLAHSPVAGDLVYSNATPKWTGLAIGSAGTLLGVSGGLPAYLSSPSITGLTLSGLTVSQPIVSDGSKALVSLAYTGATSFRKNLGLETSDSPSFTNLTATGTLAVTGTSTLTGAVAFGGSAAAAQYGISSTKNYTDPTSAGAGLFMSLRPTFTSAPGSPLATYFLVNDFVCNPIVNADRNNSGYVSGIRGQILRNNNGAAADDGGTLAEIRGLQLTYGHYNATGAANPQTTLVYGLNLAPYYVTGTIGTLYDIYLGAGSSGGTITTRWGIYQASTSNNALGGNLRVGSTTAPTVALDVTGAVKVSTTATVTGAFGCNAATAQTAYASGGALNAYSTGVFGLNSDANMSALHALVVKIRAALVANGIMS